MDVMTVIFGYNGKIFYLWLLNRRYYYNRTIKWSRTNFFIDNQPEEPEEDDNIEEADTPDEDLSISAVFKMLANYIALKA